MKQKIKILIVEDEALFVIRVEKDLKNLGYQVCKPVATGEAAIKSAAEEQPDIVLMDVRLASKMDGIKAAQEIRARREIPIIFMSGYSDQEVERRARELNPVAYLVKPVQIRDIESAIASVFKTR
ncbi:MAG: response regulator [Anaerolineae bacterium]